MVAAWFALSTDPAGAAEWYGNAALQWRLFNQPALQEEQYSDYGSFSIEPTFHHQWDEERNLFAFVPFARFEQYDAERSHADIRELTWVRVGNDWELRLGIRKVFWGVTEAVHLVDIINQTDLVENVDGEDKLGQPMVNLSLVRNWGIVDFFVLPYFRERTFAAAEGRPRTVLPVDTGQAQYESDEEQRHVDYAFRWSRAMGDWDVGLSWFKGTGRDPQLIPGTDSTGQLVLIPSYEQIEQFGLDMQATKGDWLWKLEAIRRELTSERFAAATGGFEYTFVGVSDTPSDLGVVLEYVYDERGKDAPTGQDDNVLLGLRWTSNDTQSTEALLGVTFDSDARFYFLEANRRLGQDWKLGLEGRWFSHLPSTHPLFANRNDDFVTVDLAWFF